MTAPPATKKGILERLAEGPVLGDGGFVFELEKRGYVRAGPWTPEAAVEDPDAVKQLHREFLRAGSDVMQTFTFYASEDKLENRGNPAAAHGVTKVNDEACRLAREVADEGGALVAGGICQTPTYLSGGGKEKVQQEFQKQVDSFMRNKVDFIICEYFEHVEESLWALEVAKKSGLPCALNLCIGEQGDMHGLSAGDCAVQMARAGADIVGVNCHFGPFETLRTMKLMKAALDAAGLKPYLMAQPLSYHTPDAGKQGFIDLPEFPFALEPRVATRWDMHKFAREAYDLGVRYLGGCCGITAYHIRAMAEELAKERGRFPKGSEKHEQWGGGLLLHTKPWVRARAKRSHWEHIQPASGRPHCPACSKPEDWGVTAGDALLKQDAKAMTEKEIGDIDSFAMKKRHKLAA